KAGSCLVQLCRSGLHPAQIREAVICRITIGVLGRNDFNCRAKPAVNLRMPVGEREAAGAVMIAGWRINDGCARRVAVIVGRAHFHGKYRVVNAEWILIHNDPSAAWLAKAGKSAKGFPPLGGL